MSHPKVLVEVDGKPVSGAFFDRLVSLSIVDNEGIKSDTLNLVFDDSPPHFASPRRGANVSVTLMADGIGGVLSGSYIVDKVEMACLPYTISVQGHAADLQAGMKTAKARHWDKASVKSIVTEIAGNHGLAPKIAEAVSSFVYDWIGQLDETDLAFLTRLAKRHSALFSIKNGTLLWLERGKGTTAAGGQVPVTTIVRGDVIEGSCKVSESDVERFKTVKAYWQDRAGSARQSVVVPGDPKAKGEKALSDPFASKAEAEAAAKSAAREMVQGARETSCSVVGRPSMMAGQPVTYAGVRPSIDGTTFILQSVTHSYSKGSGLRTSFTGKQKAE